MCCAIWYHLYSLKNVKSTNGGVLILVKLQASASNFSKINSPLWLQQSFTFFRLYKCYQIAQRITYTAKSTHPRIHTNCYNHATHMHQIDLHSVRVSSISDKSNHKIYLVFKVLRYLYHCFSHTLRNCIYFKSSSAELS